MKVWEDYFFKLFLMSFMVKLFWTRLVRDRVV
jgi:hypothetical protein